MLYILCVKNEIYQIVQYSIGPFIDKKKVKYYHIVSETA